MNHVLDDVAAFVRRHVVFPTDHALTAVTLWIAHTWAAERFYVTPRLVLDSAEPGSGKTRVLELLALLCRRPKLTISTTVAALYRRIAAADVPLTVLMDEVDALFGPRPTPQAEDMRALINSGYKRGATVDRCVGDGKSIKVEEFSVFAPVALAGLAGRMPPTITTRSVVIHMRRRAPGERVEPFRERDALAAVNPIRERLAGWVDSVAEQLEAARPVMPDRVTDRASEVWEALLAVADAAGEDWPERAREACRYFVLDTDPGELSMGARLLADVRDVFTARDADRMASGAVVAALVELEEAPWSDLWGKPLDQRRLAKELGRYGVGPVQFKLDGQKHRGYVTWATARTSESAAQTGLADAWNRYLPTAGTAGTAGTAQLIPVPDADPVPDGPVPGTGRRSALTRHVPPVPAVPANSRPPCALCGLDQPGPRDHAGRCTHCRPSTAEGPAA